MTFDDIIAVIDRTAKNKGVKYHLNLLNFEELKMESENSMISSYESSRTSGFNMRLFEKNRVSFSYCMGLSEEKAKDTFDKAYSLLKYMDENEYAGIAEKWEKNPSFNEKELGIYSEERWQIDIETKKAALIDMEETAYAYDKRVYKVDKPTYTESFVEKRVINSNGLDLSSRKTFYEIFLSAAAKSENDTGSGFDFDFSHDFKSLKFKKTSMNAAKKGIDQLGAVLAPSGKYNVIFDNFTSSEFLSLLKQSFYSSNVYKKKSLLDGKIGQKVFSDGIDIIDDGLLRGGASTDLFDAEGTPMQTKTLCASGVLNSFLFDMEYASRFNLKSTGNSATGSLMSPPDVGSTNFYIKHGDTPLIDMIGGLKRGLYINELMGLHMAKPYTGEFSLGASGFSIMNGKLDRPVKGIIVSGNLLRIFGRVVKLGDDLRFFGGVGSPSILFEGINVSGK